jgi:hypothetical protein
MSDVAYYNECTKKYKKIYFISDYFQIKFKDTYMKGLFLVARYMHIGASPTGSLRAGGGGGTANHLMLQCIKVVC